MMRFSSVYFLTYFKIFCHLIIFVKKRFIESSYYIKLSEVIKYERVKIINGCIIKIK